MHVQFSMHIAFGKCGTEERSQREKYASSTDARYERGADEGSVRHQMQAGVVTFRSTRGEGLFSFSTEASRISIMAKGLSV